MCCAEIMIRYINTERAGDKVFQFPNRRSFFQRFVKVLPFGLWTANPQAEEGEMIERKCSVPMCGCVVQLLHPMRPKKKGSEGHRHRMVKVARCTPTGPEGLVVRSLTRSHAHTDLHPGASSNGVHGLFLFARVALRPGKTLTKNHTPNGRI